MPFLRMELSILFPSAFLGLVVVEINGSVSFPHKNLSLRSPHDGMSNIRSRCRRMTQKAIKFLVLGK